MNKPSAVRQVALNGLEGYGWNEPAYPEPTRPVPLNRSLYLTIAGRVDPELKEIGKAIFEDGCVTVESSKANEAYYLIDDSELDQVCRVHLWTDKQSIYLSCTCPPCQETPKLVCEHKQASYLHLIDTLRPSWHSRPPRWDAVVDGLLEPDAGKSTTAKQVLLFSLQHNHNGWGIVPYGVSLSHFRDVDLDDPIAIRNAAARKDLSDEVKLVNSKFDPNRYVNLTETTAWLGQAAQLAEKLYRDSKLSLDHAFRALADQPFFVGDYSNPLRGLIEIDDEPGRAVVDISRERRALKVTTSITHRGVKLAIGTEALIVTDRPIWALAGKRLFRIPDAGSSFASWGARSVRVPTQEQARFLADYLPRFVERYEVSSDMVTWNDIDADIVPRLYLSESEGDLVADVRFAYDTVELPAERAPSSVSIRATKPADRDTIPLTRIHRKVEQEAEFYRQLAPAGFKRGHGYDKLILKASLSPVDFLLHSVPKLTASGFEVYGEENLASVRVNRNQPRLEFKVSSGIDWLDLNAVVTFGDLPVSLADFSKAIKRRERYVKLADGSIGAIPPEWIERYKHLFSFGELTDDGLRLSNRHAVLIEDAMELADAAQSDRELEVRRDRLRTFSKITEHPLPAGLTAELRPYQKAGFDWLHFLHEYDFGGCLADDMGVGKTVQALAFLLSLKEGNYHEQAGQGLSVMSPQDWGLGGRNPSTERPQSLTNLIVLPRSLIFNWEREVKKFTPGLRVLVHAENKRSRDIAHLDEYDLVLTTYGVMLRDINVLRKYRFHYVILDEAQVIKNPLSLTGRSARMLQSDHRLVLTGTPVENSTIDLWSQFEFLNPGLLGGLEYFRTEFSAAIEKKQDDASASLLRRMVFPFILRRTKDQVATDLPPRTEKILLAEMEPDQQKLYNQVRDKYRDELLGIINKDGVNNARMKMLEALLRLRQIANHPKLMDDESTVESGKFELLMETLETLRAEGHKALVFSQFVRMLTIVRNRLDADGVPYQYLDGLTKDRPARVDSFQGDPNIPFFLISLKAGGVGLNLTAADYVVHIDPWWNPAVERQATDRTHRIGQDKPVFVYKLISRGTVEEKILDLQERKRKLVDQLVAGEQSFLKSLTKDDVSVLFS